MTNPTVLHVVEASLGGSGRVVIELARAAAARGDRVALLYDSHRADRGFQNAVASLRESGVSIRDESLRPAVTLQTVRTIRMISRVSADWDVIHLHGARAGLVGRLLPSRSKVVYSPHGGAFHRRSASRRLPVRYVETLLASRTQLIVVSSRYEHSLVRSVLHGTKPNVIVIEHGVASWRMAGRIRETHPGEPLRVGMAALFLPLKRHDLAIRAVARARQKGANVMLLLAGDGPLMRRMQRLTMDLRASNVIHFLGYVANLAEFYANIDVLMITSDSDSASLAVREALAAGRPVITTDCGGPAEAIANGVNGIVVPTGDVEALADALVALASERQQLAAASAAAAEMGRGLPTWEAVAAKYVSAYRALFEVNT